jgi:hypothetical protein
VKAVFRSGACQCAERTTDTVGVGWRGVVCDSKTLIHDTGGRGREYTLGARRGRKQRPWQALESEIISKLTLCLNADVISPNDNLLWPGLKGEPGGRL